jgi:hypothetical protein
MKNKLRFLFLLIIFFMCHSTALAEFYKWTDKNGVLHMSTTPPNQAEAPSESKTEKVKEAGDYKKTENQQPGTQKKKVYTSESTIQAKREWLYARIDYSTGECKTAPLGPGVTRPNREENCDKETEHYEAMLRSLEDDPDRFFYVQDQLTKKNRGEDYDNPPRYPLTYIW